MQSMYLIIFLLVELAIGKSDVDAILELKKGFKKDPSGKVFGSWDYKSLASNGCPLDWYGIHCSDGQVISIMLNDLGLVGNFDFSAISGLKMLRNLSISNNHFKGTIVEEVGLMESLQHLDISCNLFVESISSQLTNLENLVLLNLSYNSFEGKIPSSFGNLEQLKYLDFRSNGFSGDVMSFLSQLDSVVYVDISSNGFSGFLDLGLGNSNFVSAVQFLNLSHNNLGGELFYHDGMPYFDNLEVFDASNNQFMGNVPSFSFVVSLRVLRLGSNHLTGSLPEALLQENSMILSELDLSLNQLEGPVGSITSATLKNLNLSYNKLSGPLPAKVGHCATIDLSNNLLSGNISRIQGWGNYVEIIDLSSNKLTGTLPDQTSQFLRLMSFKISNNSLEGVLPPMIGIYPELKRLDLSLNHLSGVLLSSLFNSTKLIDINLSFNNFSGKIPIDGPFDEFTWNLRMVSLNLSHNALSGHLSQGLRNFHKILQLDLSNNLFEGGIPDDLPDEIKGFNVSYNNLSGFVPENLRKFPDSAFHPGNSLLIFPSSDFPPKHDPNMIMRRHGSHMKSVVRDALIAGLVAFSFSIVVILFLVIYYRIHKQDGGRKCVNEIDEKKSLHQGVASIHGTSILKTNLVPSPASVNLPQHRVISPRMGSAHVHLGTLPIQRTKDIGLLESLQNSGEKCSPMSLMSSANPSYISQNQLEISDSLKICSPDKLAGDLHLFDSSLVFSAEELSCSPAEIIGRSCHGTLYKAMLPTGHVLAVKWLKEGIAKGRKEFSREAKKLGNIRHPNLISLQGYYWGPKDHEKLIISNYISGSSLDLYLHGTELRNFPPLTLDERLKISTDIARCLSYLHSERAIPHGNLKSKNILLETASLNTLLTDYSLHRIMTSAGTAEQVLNAAALGYRPPEFASTSKPCPSLKSDVYAFGVILLELLTGKSSTDIVSVNKGVVDLTEWVILLAAENRPSQCFDVQLLDGHNTNDLPKGLDDMLQVALRCILPAAERPDINSVFEDLSLIALEQN